RMRDISAILDEIAAELASGQPFETTGPVIGRLANKAAHATTALLQHQRAGKEPAVEPELDLPYWIDRIRLDVEQHARDYAHPPGELAQALVAVAVRARALAL